MNSPRIGAAALLGLALPLAALAAADPLRYRFHPDTTNVYQVRIETTSETGTVKHEGQVMLVTRRVTPDGAATFALQGRLAIPQGHSLPTMYHPMMQPGTAVPPYIALPPFAEIEVDPSGRVLSEAGSVPIPLQAGRLGALLFVPLPPNPDRSLKTTSEVEVPDFTPRQGMPWRPPYYDGMGYNRGGGGATLTALRTGHVTATNIAPASAGLVWTTTLDSLRQFEGHSSVSAVSEGTATLDREKGWLTAVRLTHRESSASETVTRRSRLTFEARLLAGAELETAITRARPQTADTLTPDQVRAALDDLTSTDPEKRARAANSLQAGNWDSLPPGLVARAEELLQTTDDAARWAATRVLTSGATSAQVPTLLRLLREQDSGNRQPSIEALGRLKDSRAVEPLVGMIARGDNDRYAATQALTGFGAEAEDAVLSLFQEKNLETRRAACQILGGCGTAKSLEILRNCMLDPDRQLRDAASQAVGEIASRQP